MEEIVNRIIVSFEDILTRYEDNPVEIKTKLLDSRLKRIIGENPDIDLFDYFCEFYNKENNLKEIESFLDISKFVYDGTSLEQIIESYNNIDEELRKKEIYKFLVVVVYALNEKDTNFLNKIAKQKKESKKNRIVNLIESTLEEYRDETLEIKTERIKERINNENNLMELEILLDDCRIASDLNLEEITQKIIDYKNSISNRNNNNNNHNILKNRITYEFLTKYIDETKR